MDSKTNNIILIPTDFSEVCNNAINQGVEIAGFLRHKICLLHVVNKETKNYLKKKNLNVNFIDDKLNELSDKITSQFSIEVITMVKEGSIFSIIPEVTSEVGANIIMLGTHGKAGFQKLVGSYAMKVVLKSPVPVIVVQKRPFAHGYKNIVFPITDFMEDRQKVKWAVYLAKTFNSSIHLFQKNVSNPAVASRVTIVTRHITDEFDKYNINYIVKKAENRSKYADQVLDYAVTQMGDMIMIMTESEIPEPEFKLASWAEKLIFNTSQIPVMCLNSLALNNIYYTL